MAERDTRGTRPGERRTTDGLVAALDLASPTPGTKVLRVDELFGDRPEVLDALRRARARGVGPEQMARLLTQLGGQTVSPSAVSTWLRAQGLQRVERADDL